MITTLPFPMSIPVDNNLKSLALSVENRFCNVRILAQTFLTALIGGDTALTVDVSDLPQKTEGKVNMRTKHLRGRFKKPVFYLV